MKGSRTVTELEKRMSDCIGVFKILGIESPYVYVLSRLHELEKVGILKSKMIKMESGGFVRRFEWA